MDYLELKKLQTNSRLMRLLPADIARKYHALPISTDGSKITIAMAHPEDVDACKVVTSAIGAPSCLVQVDQQQIDRILAEVWPQNPTSPLRLLLWNPTSIDLEDIQPYAEKLAELLDAHLMLANTPWCGVKSFDEFVQQAERFNPDLIIFQIPNPPLMKRLLVDFAVNKLIDRLPSSILVVKNPIMPFTRLLLVIREGHDANDSAVDWLIRLAHCSHAAVTIMPLVPPVPEMYGRLIQNNLPALLTSNDPLGKKLRSIAHRLEAAEIEGIFKLRNGPPLEQIRCEMFETNTDLVIIAAEPKSHIWRWVLGELVNDLYVWFDRPLLITKPTIN